MSTSHTDLVGLDPVLAGVYRRGHAIRRQRVVRRLAAAALSLQLVVALPFALRQGDDAGGQRVRIVAPAAPEETTTTTVPVAVEGTVVTPVEAPATTSTTAPPTTTTAPAALGVVSGTVSGGPGGRGEAHLENAAGQAWHQIAAADGAYRFDVPAGTYDLTLAVESAPAPCEPEGPCIGTAVMLEREQFELAPGEVHRRDFEPYGPPAATTTTTTTTVPTSD